MSFDYVRLGDTIRLYFDTGNSAGAATNADSTPTVTIYENGTAIGYAPTVTNKSTGLYEVQIDVTAANGFSVGKVYGVTVSATVGGVVGKAGIGSFTVDGVSCKAVTGTLTATQFTTDLGTPTTDAYKDAFFKFVTGTLTGQVKKITGSSNTGTLSFTSGFTGAPSNGDRGVIING